MTTRIQWIEDGSVTSPAGFSAGAVYASIKTYGVEPRFDVGILASDRPCVAAGLFTRNQVCGAPVRVSREHLANGAARAIVANSGCSNVAMGERGLADARRMTQLAAAKLGIGSDDVLVGSTGVIGRPLPMDAIERAIDRIHLSESGGAAFARAIMTTDTVPKSRALRVDTAAGSYTLGGVAKGSGMAHPDMATVFCFLTTDAPVGAAWWQRTLREAADLSINMVDVDMDTSTSDTMIALANGAAGGEAIDEEHPAARGLSDAMRELTVALARDLARDGEGARTLIEVNVTGAASTSEAREAARTVVSSPLVKTMVTGRDPNLGRVLMALGRSRARVEEHRVTVWIGDHCAFERGAPTELDLSLISAEMETAEVRLRADLGLGEGSATAWGCDLTEDYVRINADYTT